MIFQVPQAHRSEKVIIKPGEPGKKSCECRIVKHWNCLPSAVTLKTDERTFKNCLGTYLYVYVFHYIFVRYGLFGESFNSRSLNTNLGTIFISKAILHSHTLELPQCACRFIERVMGRRKLSELKWRKVNWSPNFINPSSHGLVYFHK